MNPRNPRPSAKTIAGALLAVFLFALPACSSKGLALCTEPSERCACRSSAQSETALAVLTDQASPAFASAMQRITTEGTRVFDDGRLGLDGKPTVILATYDDTGALHEVGSFNLEGQGDSAIRKDADAKLQAACLTQAAAKIPTDGRGANLLRALAGATSLAEARGENGAAVLAFGLSRSSVEGRAFDQIELGSLEARSHLIDELTRVGILSRPEPVAVTFMDPDEGIASGITAGFINKFAEDQLCAAVATDFCQRLEVFP